MAETNGEVDEHGLPTREQVQNDLEQGLNPCYIRKAEMMDGLILHTIQPHMVRILANDIFGENGWRWQVMRESIDYKVIKNKKISLAITCVGRVTLAGGTYQEDIGVSSVHDDPEIRESFLRCCRFAEADAMKRVLRRFGYALGGCLYDSDFLEFIESLHLVES